jgi:hypothetical protein
MQQKVDDLVYKVLAHQALGFTLFAQVNLLRPTKTKRSISLWRDSKAAAYFELSAQDPRVHARSYDGMALCLLGFPDQALRLCAEARIHADASQDAFSEGNDTGSVISS